MSCCARTCTCLGGAARPRAAPPARRRRQRPQLQRLPGARPAGRARPRAAASGPGADGQEEEVQDEYWEEETATSSSTFTNKCVRTFGAWQGGLSLLLVLTHSLGKGVTASGLGGRPGRATTARLSARCRVLKALRRRGGGCAACTRVLRRGPGHHLALTGIFRRRPAHLSFPSTERTHRARATTRRARRCTTSRWSAGESRSSGKDCNATAGRRRRVPRGRGRGPGQGEGPQ